MAVDLDVESDLRIRGEHSSVVSGELSAPGLDLDTRGQYAYQVDQEPHIDLGAVEVAGPLMDQAPAQAFTLGPQVVVEPQGSALAVFVPGDLDLV